MVAAALYWAHDKLCLQQQVIEPEGLFLLSAVRMLCSVLMQVRSVDTGAVALSQVVTEQQLVEHSESFESAIAGRDRAALQVTPTMLVAMLPALSVEQLLRCCVLVSALLSRPGDVLLVLLDWIVAASALIVCCTHLHVQTQTVMHHLGLYVAVVAGLLLTQGCHSRVD
jgi:hypothetical protein